MKQKHVEILITAMIVLSVFVSFLLFIGIVDYIAYQR